MADAQTLRTQYRVGDFVTWQRRPVWKKGAKSYLIDTILRGLPIPIIFLRDIRTDLKTLKSGRDVVDGQQRIRTILSFIEPKLLKDFDNDRDAFTISAIHNEALGGKIFADLSKSQKQQILDYQFSVHSFPADTDDREILQIFARMNSTGMKLTAQELRNAEFFGRFKTVAYRIATEQLNRWRDWKVFSPDQIARMNEVELTSEFMLLIMNGVLEKNNKIINKFYDDYDSKFSDRARVSDRFRTTFDTIEALFSGEVIVDLFSNRTLFFALFATIYGLQFGLRAPVETIPSLSKKKPKPIKSGTVDRIQRRARRIKAKNIPENVLKAVRGATTDAATRRVLINYLAGIDSPCRPTN
jgi:uncharacterized protein with ParB-like and HNH nuclease domain